MKAKGIGICEWALPTPLRGPLVCRVLKDLGLAAVELKLGTVEENFPLASVVCLRRIYPAASSSLRAERIASLLSAQPPAR